MNATLDRPQTVRDLASLLGAACERVLDDSIEIRGLCEDSRSVEAGDVFFARRGSIANGAVFAVDAVSRGAVAVVSEDALALTVPVLRVADAAQALRAGGDAWYGRPQDALALVGITGTKGKTTTAHLAAAALRALGQRTAVLGTISHDLGDGQPRPSANTTPGPLDLRRLLARAVQHGCVNAVLEVSSHALDQDRTAGLTFAVAVFTNLASDHLDYHETPEAYFAAKEKLFSGLASTGTAVVNREDESWHRFVERFRGSVLTYGAAPECDLRVENLTLSTERSEFHLSVAGDGECDVRTPLVGRHNVLNLLAAVGACVALGHDAVLAAQGASQLLGVRGRLERVGGAEDLSVFVDYAHTEDALRQVLTFLGGVGALPLTCVIGCGGDRDKTKRPKMARVAAEMCAHVVLTSDNPRTEAPEAILADMRAGLDGELLERVVTVVDRHEAIKHAIQGAPAGSSVLVAGKGHETYQIVGTESVPFDDVREVERALRARAARMQARYESGGIPGDDEG